MFDIFVHKCQCNVCSWGMIKYHIGTRLTYMACNWKVMINVKCEIDGVETFLSKLPPYLLAESSHKTQFNGIEWYSLDRDDIQFQATTGCPISQSSLCFGHFLGFWSTYRGTFHSHWIAHEILIPKLTWPFILREKLTKLQHKT